MEGATAIEHYMRYIVLFNAALVGAALIGFGKTMGSVPLTDGVPEDKQNFGEFVLDFFVGRAREMGSIVVVRRVAPFLATCFLFIFVSNLMGTLPVPIINNPPTAYFSVPLAIAACSVFGTLTLSGLFNGFGGSIKHLFWPNPLQWISEVTDVLSLALRLFGNIAGEHMTLVLVMSVVPVGIPLILHVLGLIPAFVQALVFTLLTTSFVAGVVHEDHAQEVTAQETSVVEATVTEGQPAV